MTVATFVVPYAGAPGGGATGGRTQVVLAPVGSGVAPVVLTITDPATTHTGLAPQTATLPRPGRKPFLYWLGPNLRGATLSVVLDGRGTSIEGSIAALGALLDTEVTVGNYGPMLAGSWWVTDCEIDPQRREAGTNSVTRAAVKLSLTEASDDVGVAQATTVVTNP